MAKMNWHEWLQAEGFLDSMSPGAKEALASSLQAQQAFREIETMIREAGLQKMSPCPIGLMVTAVTRLGDQSNSDTQVVFQVLLSLIQKLSHRIEVLETRGSHD